MFRKLFLLTFLSLIITTISSIKITWAQENIRNKVTKEYITDNQIIFEENLGQLDKDVKFYTRSNKFVVYLYDEGIVFVCNKSETKDRISYFKFNFINTEENVEVVGINQLRAKSNYIYESVDDNYKDISNYSKVMYKNIYKGIDLIFYESNGDIKYDFIVKPGANPNDINIEVEESDEMRLDNNGNLIVSLDNEVLLSEKPYIYQMDGKLSKEIKGNYQLLNEKNIRFKIEDYNEELPLIIDPIITYSTYFGGNSADEIGDIAIDDENNIYVVGLTSSADFPIVNGYKSELTLEGYYEIFVSKFDASGQLIYSTYVGQSWINNDIYHIAVDNNGCAYVGGTTGSIYFPTTPGAYDRIQNGNVDGIVFKLNQSGNTLLYSTYIGTSAQEGIHDIAVDENGCAYVTGVTYDNTVFPTTENAYQNEKEYNKFHSFVTKFSPGGTSLVYSTLIKGVYTYGITVDSSGNAYITGRGLDYMPIVGDSYQDTLGGERDGFVLKLNKTGSNVLYSTFLGGEKDDEIYDIAVDNEGNAYVTGYTYSTDFPVVNAYQDSLTYSYYDFEDAFVTKLNADGSDLIFSTYLGGTLTDIGCGITVNSIGEVYVTGSTASTNFPSKSPIVTYSGGYYDVFVSLFDSNGHLMFSTDFGGTNLDLGESIVVDSNNSNIYVGGRTYSTNYIVTDNAFQKYHAGGYDEGFITKISMVDEPVSPTADIGGPYEITEGESLVLDASNSVDPDVGDYIKNYEWDLNNDGIFDVTTVDSYTTISWNELMNYSLELADRHSKTPVNIITLRVTDTTDRSDTDYTILTILPSFVSVDGVILDEEMINITKGEQVTIVATVTPDNASNKNLIWNSADERIAIVENGVITGVGPGTTTITVTKEDGGLIDEVTVEVEFNYYTLIAALSKIPNALPVIFLILIILEYL